MDSMIERVALSMAGSGLFEHISGHYGVIWKAEQLPEQYQFRGDAIARIDELRARAAIEAMREPTEAMIRAGGNAPSADRPTYVEDIWAAMIAASLSPLPTVGV